MVVLSSDLGTHVIRDSHSLDMVFHINNLQAPRIRAAVPRITLAQFPIVQTEFNPTSADTHKPLQSLELDRL
jgi:hypothetical protein